MNEILRIMKIVRGTTVDGPGLRTSIYIAGCRHHCPGCHNPSTWDFDAGEPMSIKEIADEVEHEGNDVTLTGGDPLMYPKEIKVLASEIRKMGLKIWLYSGYTWEEILKNPDLVDALDDIDVIVEGRYMEEFRNPDLLFRGSSNQRILHLTEKGRAEAWHDPMENIFF